jgi:hypothetical protein
MTDKPKDTKIRAIHKGIQLPTEEPVTKVANPNLVAAIEALLEEVKNCVVTEVCWVAVGDNSDTMRGIAGVCKHPFLMSSQLTVLDMLYKEEVVYPILLNADHYEDIDE